MKNECCTEENFLPYGTKPLLDDNGEYIAVIDQGFCEKCGERLTMTKYYEWYETIVRPN